jgi:hypothetical protein
MSSVLNCLACVLALTVSESSLGQASDTTFVSEGARVKVFPASGATAPVIGIVVDMALDTLIVLTELQEVLAYHSSDLSRIEVSEGQKKKTLLGLWAGAGLGWRRDSLSVGQTRRIAINGSNPVTRRLLSYF